jgi:hypothetical protein
VEEGDDNRKERIVVPYLFLLASFIDKRALSFSLSIFPQHLWSSFALLRSSSSPSFVWNRHPSITTLLTFEVRKSNADFRDAFLLFRVRILPSGFLFLAF